MKVILIIIGLLTTIVTSAQTSTSDVWINEFHYDHVTSRGESDTAEFIELAMKNSIASNAAELAKYTIILYTSGAYDQTAYNLGRGLPYNVSSSWYTEAETNHVLTSFQQCPVAGSGITLLYKKLPILQDIPAAIALVYNNTTVVQLLSYEKAFKIAPASSNAGPAAGMTTTLITKPDSNPTSETALSDPNHSVSLLGAGTSYNNFQWSDDPIVRASRCAPNTNGTTTQSFASALPIHWLSFAASSSSDKINIQWKVANNNEVASYIIELSPINAAFKNAGTITAASNSSTYQSTISNVAPGTYKIRIKSISVTGEIEYSETKVVKIGGGKNMVLNVFPNPVRNGKLNVQIIPNERSAYTIQVIDLNGKVISSRLTSMFEANSFNTVPLNISQVAQGVYHVKIFNASEQHSTKIVVVK